MAVPDEINAPDNADYTLRVSKRAKHVRLRISPVGELVVVVPESYNQRHLDRLIAGKRSWIDQTRDNLRQQRLSADPSALKVFPDVIYLGATDKRYTVSYQPDDTKQITLSREPGELIITGNTTNRMQVHRVLRDWLRKKAKEHLIPRLREISRESGLHYERVSIRNQKTRWGSCSSRGTISLNQKLMLLSSDAVTYVLLHELAHTQHFDHGKAFWALVKSYVPNYRQLDTNLKLGWRTMPLWVDDL